MDTYCACGHTGISHGDGGGPCGIVDCPCKHFAMDMERLYHDRCDVLTDDLQQLQSAYDRAVTEVGRLQARVTQAAEFERCIVDAIRRAALQPIAAETLLAEGDEVRARLAAQLVEANRLLLLEVGRLEGLLSHTQDSIKALQMIAAMPTTCQHGRSVGGSCSACDEAEEPAMRVIELKEALARERAGAAALRAALEEPHHSGCSIRCESDDFGCDCFAADLARKALSSAAGADLLAAVRGTIRWMTGPEEEDRCHFDALLAMVEVHDACR